MTGRLQCRASLAPASLEGRSVRAVLHTGQPLRYSAGEAGDPYSVHFVRVDLAGVEHDETVPLLCDHENHIGALAGVVDEIQLSGDRLIGRLTIDEGPEGDRLIGKIKSGSLRAVSVGLDIVELVPAGEHEGLPFYVAQRTRLRELSLTPVGRDVGALIMSEPIENVAKVAKVDPVAEIRNAYRAAENLGLVVECGQLLDAGHPAGSIPEMLIQASAERARVQAGAGSILAQARGASIGGLNASGSDLSHEIGEALEARLSGRGNGGKLGGKRVIDLCEMTLSAAGYNMSASTPDEVLRAAYSPSFKAAAHSTSDFPALLRDSANKSLLRGYEAAKSPLTEIFRRNDARDFKPKYITRMGESPKLLEVAEGAEVLSGTTTEQEASWKLKTFGRIFTISRVALINDDLGGFANFLQQMAVAAGAAEADTLYAVLSANSGAGQTLGFDNTAIFDAAAHKNVAATPAAPSVTSIGAAVELLRLQVALSAEAGWPIVVEPRTVLVGPKSELAARQALASVALASARSEIQPWDLTVAVEPRLGTSAAWYLFAAPETAPIAEYGYLSSAPGPQLASEENFETLGISMRCVFDIGAGAVDYRGAVRNAGA